MTAHMDFRVLREHQIQWGQPAVLLALVDRRAPGRHRPGQGERRVAHAERCADPLGHHVTEPFAANRLDHLTGPVDVRPVLPFRARIEQQRRLQRRPACRDHAGLVVFHPQPVVGLVEEVVSEPGGVQQQHAGGDVAHRGPGDRLGGGEDREHGVGVHRFAVGDGPHAGRTLEHRPVAVGHHRHHPGYPRRIVRGDIVENLVERGIEHRTFHSRVMSVVTGGK